MKVDCQFLGEEIIEIPHGKGVSAVLRYIGKVELFQT
jgi:hypothetical protein